MNLHSKWLLKGYVNIHFWCILRDVLEVVIGVSISTEDLNLIVFNVITVMLIVNLMVENVIKIKK